MRKRPIVLMAALALAGAGCGGEDAELVSGDGYRYEVPGGWQDRSGEALEEFGFAGYTPDTAVTAESEEGFADNVNVIVERSIAPGVGAREYAQASVQALRNPEALPGELRRVLEQQNARDFTGPTRVELDGEEAYATEYTGDMGGRVLRFRNVVALRDGRAYGVTYTALRHRFRESADDAERVFDTWDWR